MLRSCLLVLTLAIFVTAQMPHEVGAGEWHEEEGASIRLVTSGPPSRGGRLEGALEVRLEPGWKTYWRQPGESGVPPSISIAPEHDMAQPVIEFPPPVWIDDGFSRWAGYEKSVAFPVSFETGDMTEAFEAEVFLGLCDTVCIPVQASFVVDPNLMFSHSDAARVVRGAMAKLPGPERSDFRAWGVEIEREAVIVRVNLPDGADQADLFIATDDVLNLGQPELERRSGANYFRLPLMNGDNVTQLRSARYTLVTGDEAVQGVIDFAR